MQRSEVVASACGYSDIKTWGGGHDTIGIKAVSLLSSHHFNMRIGGRFWKRTEPSPKACLVQTECLLQTGTNPRDL